MGDQDAGLPQRTLERSATCPSSVPPTRTSSLPEYSGSCGRSCCNDIVRLPERPRPMDGEENASTLKRTESTSTIYAWPVYEMRTMALPIPARSFADGYDSNCEQIWR